MRNLANLYVIANIKDDPANVVFNALHSSPTEAWKASVAMYFGEPYASYSGYRKMMYARGFRAVKVQLVTGA